ncbi:MAG: hypothetical protein AB1758_22145, partial [Candidatus Eremiobacterota bacterium]
EEKTGKEGEEKTGKEGVEMPPDNFDAKIQGDPHVGLDLDRDGLVERNERLFDLHTDGEARDVLRYGNTSVDVHTATYDNGLQYAEQVDVNLGNNSVSLAVGDSNQLQITQTVDGREVALNATPGSRVVLDNGTVMTVEQRRNQGSGLNETVVTFTEPDGTITRVTQVPHQISGASQDHLDVAVDTNRTIVAGHNTITGVGDPNRTYTLPGTDTPPTATPGAGRGIEFFAF